jgi:hypothetical protein
MTMSDSKRDELMTHYMQTRCARRADTNDLARGQRVTYHADGTRTVRATSSSDAPMSMRPREHHT